MDIQIPARNQCEGVVLLSHQRVDGPISGAPAAGGDRPVGGLLDPRIVRGERMLPVERLKLAVAPRVQIGPARRQPGQPRARGIHPLEEGQPIPVQLERRLQAQPPAAGREFPG